MKLNQIAYIRTGYQFRGTPNFTPYGTYACIRMSDTDENRISYDHVNRINLENVKDRHLVKRDSILMLNRGNWHTAYLIDRDLENTITDANFYIITITDPNYMLPEILNYFLNLEKTQTLFDSESFISEKSIMSLLTIDALNELEIPAIPMDKQKRIANHILSTMEEEAIILDILSQRREHISEMIRNA